MDGSAARPTGMRPVRRRSCLRSAAGSASPRRPCRSSPSRSSGRPPGATSSSAGIVAVAISAVLAVARLLRRQTTQFALSGVLGVAFGAFVASRTGKAEDFFLPGILINAGSATAYLVSILVRRPLLGLIVSTVTGEGRAWYRDPERRLAYTKASWIWVGLFCFRLVDPAPALPVGAGRAARGRPGRDGDPALRARRLALLPAAAEHAPRAPPPNRPDRSLSARAWTSFAVVSVLWGIPYLFISIAVDHGVSPGFLAWSRVLLGALVLLPFVWRAGLLGSLRRHWRWLLVYAIVEISIPFPLIAFGEEHVSSSVAAILIAATPLIVAVLALRVRPQRAGRGAAARRPDRRLRGRRRPGRRRHRRRPRRGDRHDRDPDRGGRLRGRADDAAGEALHPRAAGGDGRRARRRRRSCSRRSRL